jgi:hypothetical protein
MFVGLALVVLTIAAVWAAAFVDDTLAAALMTPAALVPIAWSLHEPGRARGRTADVESRRAAGLMARSRDARLRASARRRHAASSRDSPAIVCAKS